MKLIRFLKSCDATLDAKNKAGYTPIDVASYNNDRKVVNYFKNEGVEQTNFFNPSY
jgi:ankyrin repeat protein